MNTAQVRGARLGGASGWRAARGGLTAVAMALSLRGTAHADAPPGLVLEWSAPPGCPDGPAARGRVEQLLGGPGAMRSDRALAVHATVTRSAAGADVLLTTVDGPLTGARSLHGATCEEVTSAAALVIALAIDPKAVSGRAPESGVGAFDVPAPGPPEGGPAPSAAPPTTAVPVQSAPSAILVRVPVPVTTRTDSSAFLDAGVLIDGGSLPAASAGPIVRAGVGSRRLGARLGVAYLVPRFAAAPPRTGRPTRGADVSLLTAELQGCYAIVPGATALHVCAGLEAGGLFAEGTGFERSNAALAPWLAATSGLELGLRVAGPVVVRGQLGAAVPFGRSPVRFRTAVGNTSELVEFHRPSVVGARAVIAASVSFF